MPRSPRQHAPEPLAVLLDDHAGFEEAFARHQEALLMRNVAGAKAHLARFRGLLVPHLEMEEALFLPIFAARGAAIVGASPAVFTAEHATNQVGLAGFGGGGFTATAGGISDGSGAEFVRSFSKREAAAMLRYLLPLALLAAGAPVLADDRQNEAASARAVDADCACGRAHRPLTRREVRRELRQRRAEGRSYPSPGYLAPGYAAYGAFEGYGGIAYSPYGPAYFGERGPSFRRRD